MKTVYVQGISISRARFILVAGLVVNSIAWYYFMAAYLESLLTNLKPPFDHLWKEPILAGFFFAIPISSAVGAIILSRLRTKTVLLCWTIVDIVSVLLPSFLEVGNGPELLIFAICLGFSVGFGFPKCLAYFADSTSMEERGRVGGVTIFVTYILTTLVLAAIRSIGSQAQLIAYVIWRGLGLAAIPFITVTPNGTFKDEISHGSRTLQRKTLLLYFVPWAAFSLINGIDTHILINFYPQETLNTLKVLMYLTGSLSSVLAGIALDFFGRRTSITFAMVILGLGFATVGLAQTPLASWLLLSITEGISWSILSIAYILVVWGDLGSSENREIYYAIGMIPFFLSQALGYILIPVLSQFSSTHLFSMVTFLNFLAVIPLLFVQEVLPSDTREMRRMKDYIRRAKQLTDNGKRH